MNVDLSALAGILEEEIGLAETLSHNLRAQRAAIVAWNPATLLEELERREASLRTLGALEEKRVALLQAMGFGPQTPTLGEILARVAVSPPQRSRLSDLRERAGAIFQRVRAEERDLNGLMTAMLAHIEAALRPLAHDRAPVYTETGAAGTTRAPSALVQSKA